MNYKICLSKKLIIFYTLFGLVIGYASIHNLINIINGTGSVVSFGAFSMFGFILFPLLIIFSYLRNICHVKPDGLKIGKNEYPFSEYRFKIDDYNLPFADRPLFSLYKKTYHRFIVRNIKTKQTVYDENLEIFNSDLKKLKKAIPTNQS